jgi:type IV pilus assembly protein PilQ
MPVSPLLRKLFCVSLICLLFSETVYCQEDRFQVMEQRLKDLSIQLPGLNAKTDLSISNGSLQEFLRGIASVNNLNFNIDPSISQKISANFSDEKVLNILLFMAKEYNLDLNFIGTIISISLYKDPMAGLPPPQKELKISYNSFNGLISMDLQNDTLINIAKKITQLTKKNIVVQPELYSRLITEYVQDMSVVGSLEKMAITFSFKINMTNDDVIILEPLKPDEEIVTHQQNIPNPNFTVRHVSKSPSTSLSSIEVNEDKGKKTVTLNVINSPIKEIIKTLAEQIGINYFIYSEIQGNTTANFKNLGFDQVLSYIFQGTKYTFLINDGVYMIGERLDEGLREKKLIQLHYRSVDSLLPLIPTELRTGVQIQEFRELNSFIVSGSLPQIKEIESFVKQIDKTVPMITIEVIILDIDKGTTLATGVSAGTSDSVKTGGSVLPGLNYTFGAAQINQFISRIGLNNVFNIGNVSPNFYVTLSALATHSNVEIHQTPKLSTLNGHLATLSIGSTRYYSTSTQNVLGSLNPQTVVTQQYTPIEANLSIDILPFVEGDDQVTMNIWVNISDFTSNPPVNQPPPTSTSKFKSMVRIKNEEMVVLGGIERTEKDDAASGVPILSKIPILKWIFSSKTKSTRKVVSIVFIRPTIIYN